MKIYQTLIGLFAVCNLALAQFVPTNDVADNGESVGEVGISPFQLRNHNQLISGLEFIVRCTWVSPHISAPDYDDRAIGLVNYLVDGDDPADYGYQVLPQGSVINWQLNNSYVDASGHRVGSVVRFGGGLKRTDGKQFSLLQLLQILSSNDSGAVFNHVNIFPDDRYSPYYAGVRRSNGEITQVLKGNPGSELVDEVYFAGPAKGFNVPPGDMVAQTTAYFERNIGTQYIAVFAVDGVSTFSGVYFAPALRVEIDTFNGSLEVHVPGSTGANVFLEHATSPLGAWSFATPDSREGDYFRFNNTEKQGFFRARRR